MFSALESGEKALFHYPSEARYKESKAGYKGKILLADAVTVQCHDPEKKQQLMVAMRDGGVAFFEAASAEEALEWSTCLNAVLFGKGPSGGVPGEGGRGWGAGGGGHVWAGVWESGGGYIGTLWHLPVWRKGGREGGKEGGQA